MVMKQTVMIISSNFSVVEYVLVETGTQVGQ